MKFGSETGSMINHLMSNSAQPEPKVGDGATVLSWSDRHAATVIEVTPNRITVQLDKAFRLDKNGMSECQAYEYYPNPDGEIIEFFKNKHGAWRERFKGGKSGYGLLLGHRQAYHDYSF